MLILGIDTSSIATSLALIEATADESTPRLRAEFAETHEHPPSDAVFPILNDLLREAEVRPEAIDHFAVCVGPGSFTGLRIGLGMAKALAWSLGRPVHGFDAVEVAAARAIRQGCLAPGDTADVLFTAMRGSAFRGRYRGGADGPDVQTPPQHHDTLEEALATRDDSEPLIVAAHEELPADVAGEVRRIEAHPSSALLVAELALRAARRGDPGGLDAVQPRYLKPFSIGRKAKTRKDLKR